MEALSLVIGCAASAAAILFGIASYLRTRHSDCRSHGYRDGTVLTELGYIRSGVDDIRHRQERQEQQYISVISRLSAVEASVKEAHKRLDSIV